MAFIEDSKIKFHNRRKRNNLFWLCFCVLSTLFGLCWLVWILADSVILGVKGLNLMVFTDMTPSPNEPGGLINAIYGSFLMVFIATLIGTPIGIMTAIYLSEYGKNGLFASVTRFINDILLSAPSIVIGLFVYAIFVVPFGGFSGWAGSLALALIIIPVVVRTSENMLLLIPNALREAVYALGAPKWKMILLVVLKAAKAGIVTGILLAVARISGETAPLLFTALSNQFWTSDLSDPIASLPTIIFKFAMSTFENWQELAWAGVFIIIVSVLFLNILARYFVNKDLKRN